jgi:hypothetical protein
MTDEFGTALGAAFDEYGLVPEEKDTRANLWLVRTKRGGHLALIIKGDTSHYWGLGVSIYETVRAQCQALPGLGLAVVFLVGESGYVLGQSHIDRNRGGWSTDRDGREYKLGESHLSGFPSFRGAGQCAAIIATIADTVGQGNGEIGIELFKRHRKVTRRSPLFG